MPNPRDIEVWVNVCQAPEELEDLLDTARTINTMYREWKEMEKSGLKRAQEQVLPLWEQTLRFKSYSCSLLPGPLQTEDYTRTVLTGLRRRRSLKDDVEEAVSARMDRQRLLSENGRSFAFVVEESCLRRNIGGRDVMYAQLSHLLRVFDFGNVSLGVIPSGADRSDMWPVENFWIFDDKQVNVELVSAYLTIRQNHEVKQYTDTFRMLHAQAVFGAEAFDRLVSATAPLVGRS